MKSTLLVCIAVMGWLLNACSGPAATDPATVEATAGVTASPTIEPSPVPALIPAATRAGSEYVLLLPREAAVPADWAMNPAPSFETRDPQPGATYRFACRDLAARSVGVAAVGYRHLEGLPSIHIEYVIYPTDEVAAAALGDMRAAAEACASFTIGEGASPTSAKFSALDFPAFGDESFAAVLATDSPISGELRTHMHKVRKGHVVIGVHHTAYASAMPPDMALTESIVTLAVGNLEGGPAAPGN